MILQALRNSCQLQPQWPSIFVEIGGWRPLSLSAQHSTIEILKFSFVPSICLFLPCRRVIIFDEQLNSNEFLHTFIPVHDLSTHVPKRLLPSRSSRCRLSLEVNSTIGDVNQKNPSAIVVHSVYWLHFGRRNAGVFLWAERLAVRKSSRS